jgi:hypothetical protein
LKELLLIVITDTDPCILDRHEEIQSLTISPITAVSPVQSEALVLGIKEDNIGWIAGYVSIALHGAWVL